ncbi:hypothetical protein M422DRAFT_239245 [Sphaerobolus stellatus SS14]|nr:hypothetical protein M422DRAFT_239245 [Sphaerobolus stellatus SS14]
MVNTNTLSGSHHIPRSTPCQISELLDLRTLLRHLLFFHFDWTSHSVYSSTGYTAYVHARLEHPPGAVVEYLQSGKFEGEGVAHLFNIDLSRIHQYVQYQQLRDLETGESLDCVQQKLSRCRIKLCSFNSSTAESLTNDTRSPVFNAAQFEALREMFTKTFGFFYALIEHVYPFQHSEELGIIEQELETEDEAFVEDTPDVSTMYEVLLDNRSPRSSNSGCTGKPILRRDKYGHLFIQ